LDRDTARPLSREASAIRKQDRTKFRPADELFVNGVDGSDIVHVDQQDGRRSSKGPSEAFEDPDRLSQAGVDEGTLRLEMTLFNREALRFAGIS
jgi:hypothetical protein